MKFILFFIAAFLLAGVASLIIFLNMQPVELVLTPLYENTYYHLPRMPLGLLVVLSVVFGFLLGYIFGLVQKIL